MKFMKKTVFCVALVAALFLAVPANAQFKFGPKVGMNISTLSLSGNLSDVEIPINLKYKFSLPVVGSILSPFVYAGPSFAFRVGDNFKEQFKEKSFDTAINVGLGLELFNHLQIAGQYGWGLGSAMEVKNDLPDSVMKGKSRAWTITAAYLF